MNIPKNISFSESRFPSVRVFASEAFLGKHEKIFVIYDDEKEGNSWFQLIPKFTKKSVKMIESFADLLFASEEKSGIFLIPSAILSTEEKWHYLEKKASFFISRKKEESPEILIDQLIHFGYTHSGANIAGTYRREGDVIRIYDAMTGRENIVEYFGDEIDAILVFSGEERVFQDSVRIFRNEKNTEKNSRENAIMLDIEWNATFLEKLYQTPTILIGCDFIRKSEEKKWFEETLEFPFFPRENAERIAPESVKIENLADLIPFLQNEKKSEILAFTRYESAFSTFLDDNQIAKENIRIEYTRAGYKSWSGKLPGYAKKIVFLGDDIFSTLFMRYKTRKIRAKDLDLLLSIKSSDYVVHRDHGVGQFIGLLAKNIGGIEREYMEIAYAENDRLFLPLTELHRISKYIGKEIPELTKLSGKEWERTLEKTDEEVKMIAEELLQISARRRIIDGIAFPSFPQEEAKFREAFEYQHTPDQLQAIEEIFHDMEKNVPMDRLLAGDVGFGKTEVAMNASYKAVLSGAQVVIVSPLLVLAEEHYETFVERMSGFGVRVAVLTRMQKGNEEKKILRELRDGKIDIIIGTHRLLSEDVHFRKLGLLIIDEEHRFGVAHKERFKKIKTHLDVLMLSATPIPRSLNLALSGLKTISLLTTAPYMRKSIRTIVHVWNENIVRSAIEYELARGGQVLIMHNRIASLEVLRREIEGIFEEVGKKSPHIILAHGKLSGDEIDERIHAFKHREYDILLSTTIIENGVNFLSANTILITDPENFGLAELHQLRGRIGRKDQEGICYLLYRENHVSREGRERMMTLANNSHLGAGFEIAMRDMEIRGVGDVLGFRQAGKSKDVGISLYFELLDEKIEELKSGKKPEENMTKIELDISTAIPSEVFESDIEKLSFYRDIEAIETLYDLESVEETFLGEKENEGLENLFLLLRARIILKEYGLVRLTQIGENYVFDFVGGNVEKIRAFLERFDQGKNMILLSPIKIRVEKKGWKNGKDFLISLIGKK